MKIRPFAANTALLAALSSPLITSAGEIETTVVTATRTEQSIAEVLAPVTVFERADIERIAPLDLQELLSRAAGISFVRNGGRGSATSLFVRGNQSNHTLLLVDGVRVGSATLGSPSLTNLPPELIERVEIVRGPRSALYGSEAIGGVINIITKKYHDTDGVKPFVQLSAGTQGTVKTVAAVNGGNADTQFSLSGLYEQTDGVDNTTSKALRHGDDDGFEQQAINASVSHRFTARAKVHALYQHSDSESEYDTNCYSPFPNNFGCEPYTDSTVTVAGLRGEFQLSDNWALKLTAGQSTDESQTRYRYRDPALVAANLRGDVFETTRKQFTAQNDWQLGKHHVLTLGGEHINDEVDSTLSYGKDERENNAGFAQWQADYGRIDYALGWRHDSNEQFGSHDTRNAAAGLDLPMSMKVIASYGEGFNAPTFNDLYYPGYGNPNLEPESSKNRELELRGKHAWGQWSVNYFINDVDKLIQYNPATFGPDQIESARIEGLELSLATVVRQWHIEANATLLDTEDKNSGKELRRRADSQVNIDVDRQWQQWGVNASVRLTSDRYENTSNTDELPGYGLVDAGVSYQINDSLKLQLLVKNLFDKDYVSARHFSLGNYESIGREALLSVTYAP